jgi:uncharacterized protein YifE (UPF0438 family)
VHYTNVIGVPFAYNTKINRDNMNVNDLFIRYYKYTVKQTELDKQIGECRDMLQARRAEITTADEDKMIVLLQSYSEARVQLEDLHIEDMKNEDCLKEAKGDFDSVGFTFVVPNTVDPELSKTCVISYFGGDIILKEKAVITEEEPAAETGK